MWILLVLIFIVIFGFVIYCQIKFDKKEARRNNTSRGKIRCPRCGGMNYYAFVEEQIIRDAKVKSTTSLNLNPLKPFTVFNHKQKVVKQPVKQHVSKFVCNDCGAIFK